MQDLADNIQRRLLPGLQRPARQVSDNSTVQSSALEWQEIVLHSSPTGEETTQLCSQICCRVNHSPGCENMQLHGVLCGTPPSTTQRCERVVSFVRRSTRSGNSDFAK